MPKSIDGVPAHLFPVIPLIPRFGLSGLISPGLALWLARNISKYDAIHIHAGRVLVSVVSMAIARVRRKPYIIQTHGMIQPDNRWRARVLDALLVRRLLRAAYLRFVLTQREQDGLSTVLGAPHTYLRLFNGVPLPLLAGKFSEHEEILFCARLHARKRPVQFVKMAAELTRRKLPMHYAIVGPDDGELTAVRVAIEANGLSEVVRYQGAVDYSQVVERMQKATMYVLPSIDEPFPMSLLEALSVGLPSVCTDTCDIANILREEGAVIVTDGSVGELADAVQSIYQDQALRRRLSINSRRAVAATFSIEAIGNQLEGVYRQLIH